MIKYKDNILHLFLLIFVGLCMLKGPMMGGDSSSYLFCSSTRQPLYPMFLSFFQTIAPSLWGIVFFQLVFVSLAAIFFTNSISLYFILPLWVKIINLLIILFPYYSQSYFGNYILSEGLAYPLFVLFVTYFYLLMTEDKKSNLWKLCIVTFLLMATRKQFLFVVPVFWFISLFPLENFKQNWRHIGKNLFYFTLSIGLVLIFERAYSYYHYKEFKSLDAFPREFITAPFYVSQDIDASLFKDNHNKSVFIRARQLAKAQNLLMPDTIDLVHIYFHFTYSWNPIHPCFAQAFTENQVISPYEQKEILLNLAKTLLIKNWLNRIKLYVVCVVMGVGNLGYFLLSLSVLLMGLVFYYKKRDNLSLLIALSSLLNFANLCLVCIFEPPLNRYVYCTRLFWVSIIFITIYKQLKNQEKTE